jgi:hypothetical protein
MSANTQYLVIYVRVHVVLIHMLVVKNMYRTKKTKVILTRIVIA